MRSPSRCWWQEVEGVLNSKHEIRAKHPSRDQFETKMSNPKLETLNSKQTQISKVSNSKPFDLEDRFLKIVEKSKLPFEFYFLDLLRI